MLKGIETAVYFVDDLKAATKWYGETFGVKPNHESEYYVGFTIAGYELGLHPLGKDDAKPSGKHQTAYWSVADITEAVAHLTKHGATVHHEPTDVGGGITFAEVLDPYGNVFGVIQNPNSPNK